MTSTLTITFSGSNHELVDNAVSSALSSLKGLMNEYAGIAVATMPATTEGELRIQNRMIALVNPSDKVIAKFAKLDVPSTVSVKIREEKAK
jgi:ribosomal protein S10